MTPEELLKEVGEPVLYAEFAEDGRWLSDASDYAYHLEEPHALFTSDQVAAAIIKATKTLEDQLAKQNKPVAWCVGYDDQRMGRIHSNPTMCKPEAEALVKSTTSELIVCSLYALPPAASQIEQETAEAIAKMLELGPVYPEYIRSGAWKEFK